MKFTEPLPISKKWSVAIRCLMYGWPIVVLAILPFSILARIPPQNPIKALAVSTELEQAIQRFHDDHGVLPIEVGADMTIDCNSAKGMELLRVLMNQEESPSPRNAIGIKYLNVKQGNHNRDGLIWNDLGTEVLGLYDPWGGSYMIALDGDGNGEITVQPKAQKERRTLHRRVAVWSDGQDPQKAKDDVTTWEDGRVMAP